MASPMAMSKEVLLKKLDELGIDTHTVEHPEVYTVEESLPHISDLHGVFAKNLFLRDKKKHLWLYCGPHFREVKLNELAKQAGAPGGLRFADEDTLFNNLGVRQGCVTVFGLINDHDHKVKLILDKTFWDEVAASEPNVKITEDNKVAMSEAAEKQLDTKVEDCGSEQRLYFHPLVNSASTGVTLKGLKRFLAYTGHEPVISS